MSDEREAIEFENKVKEALYAFVEAGGIVETKDEARQVIKEARLTVEENFVAHFWDTKLFVAHFSRFLRNKPWQNITG